MRRFFVPPQAFAEGEAVITGDLFRHMAKVLRLKSGTAVLLTDGSGREFTGAIRDVGRDSLVVALEESHAERPAAAGPAITLYQGLPKGDKLELILQKSTELGVAEVVPFSAARSISRIRKGEEADRVVRWQRIALEAARQSGRTSIPRVALAGGVKEVATESRHALKLLLWEEEQGTRLRAALAGRPAPETIALIVGPEGGLTATEAAQAGESGFLPVSLGERILRTETAGLATIAILQFYWGDLG